MDDVRKMQVLTEKSDLLKTLAHPMRLCILNCLMNHAPCNVTSLTEKMARPQSTISQHLAKLKAKGIIKGERNGVEVQYRLVDQKVANLMRLLLDELEENHLESDDMC